MPTSLTWHDIALRLVLDLIAAGLIGLNRDERGRPAGFRTNILVSLAACVAMIQANLLINSNGRAADSFVVMDIMRLPLGILSGIGFIGAGAIIKRGELTVGVTTAATLWFVTVMGLCFGGGQMWLGVASFALGFLVLWAFKRVETALPREHQGELKVTFPAGVEQDREIERLLSTSGLKLSNRSIVSSIREGGPRTIGWQVRWEGNREQREAPAAIRELEKYEGVQRLEFTVMT